MLQIVCCPIIGRQATASNEKVTAVPDSLGINRFYKKYLDAEGLPVISSDKVCDEALIRTRTVILQMLSKRPDVKDYMVSKGCRVMIIGATEEVCELPEYAQICTPDSTAFWNKRARGFGGAPQDDYSASFGEENVMCLPGDRYNGESIMVHEFSHIIHTVGIEGINPDFDKELVQIMEKAKAKGLWKNTYALSDKYEYFAEAVQSFFNCNRYSAEPNGVHNSINTRDKLKQYDPDIYNLLLQYFPDNVTLDICNKSEVNK